MAIIPFLRSLGPIGFGGASIGNLYHPVADDAAEHAVVTALRAGFHYIDTAPHYGFGLSERRIGRVLATRDPRDEIIVSTKVGRSLRPVRDADLSQLRQAFVSPEPFESVFDYSYDAVMRSWEESCRRLQRDRIDILYAHDLGRMTHGPDHPAVFRTFMTGGYRAMRELRDDGAVRAIGLGVNETAVCIEALAAGDFDAILLAGRYTLLEQAPLDELLPLCTRRDVAVIIGGPFNSGILAAGSRGDGRYDYGAVPPAVLTRVAAMEAVCERHAVPLAAAALRFPLAHPQVMSVIPGLEDATQVREAAALAETAIPDAFWAEVKAEGLIRPDAPVPRSKAS
jgi:D-threo-aldose 1-dehydrogenase